MRLLKGLIIVMGVLIVAGLGVVAVTITNRMGGAAPKASKGGFGAAALAIGPGCQIVETQLSGDRMLVRTGGGAGCARIHIVDVTTGALVGTLDVTE
ncbi:MAG: hypothetical protein U1F33_02090 [Alphaproteobacteria bacterium]